MPKNKSAERPKVVAITRTEEDNAEFAKLLKARFKKSLAPVRIYHFPTIHLVRQSLNKNEGDELNNFARYDAIIFTSAHAVRFFADHLSINHFSIKKFSPDRLANKLPNHLPKIIAVGEMTAQACKKVGLKVSWVPTQFTTKNIAVGINKNINKRLSSKKILLPCSAIASPELAEILRKMGAQVDIVHLYTTKSIKKRDLAFEKLLMSVRVDYITFASPSAVDGFLSRLAGSAKNTSKKTKHAADSILVTSPLNSSMQVPAVCIGHHTARAARDAGFKKVIIARTFTAEGMAAAIVDSIKSSK